MPNIPATSKRYANLGHIEAALGWIDGPGDIDGDGFVEYHRSDENGAANEGSKDPTTRSSTPTARSRRGRSRSAKCRAMFMPPSGWRHARHAGSASKRAAKRSTPRPPRSPNDSRKHSGARTLAPMRWHWTGRSSHAACARRMPGRFCSADCRAGARGRGDARPDASVVLFRMGNSDCGARRAPLQSDVVS